MVITALRLPNYPSADTRQKLSASQLASLFQTIASTLQIVVSLPDARRDSTSSRQYVATYGASAAFRALKDIIWKEGNSSPSSQEASIQKLSLTLAEKLAGQLDIQTLLDLAVAHGRKYPTRLQKIFAFAFKSNQHLSSLVESDLVPTLTTLLKQRTPASQGLYAQRKVAECIVCFLRASKTIPELVRPFLS